MTSAVRIANGGKERLWLVNLDIWRDWGSAPEYAEAMWLMLQASQPDDFVIATTTSYSLKDSVEAAFSHSLGLDWQDHVEIDPKLFRATDMIYSTGDANKAHREPGWSARTAFSDLIAPLVRGELDRTESGVAGRAGEVGRTV